MVSIVSVELLLAAIAKLHRPLTTLPEKRETYLHNVRSRCATCKWEENDLSGPVQVHLSTSTHLTTSCIENNSATHLSVTFAIYIRTASSLLINCHTTLPLVVMPPQARQETQAALTIWSELCYCKTRNFNQPYCRNKASSLERRRSKRCMSSLRLYSSMRTKKPLIMDIDPFAPSLCMQMRKSASMAHPPLCLVASAQSR